MGVYDRILITGGAGMLAQALAGALRQRGLEPLVLDRAALDIAQKVSALMEQVISRKPTLILNCAAFTKVDACEEQSKQANAVNGFGPGYLSGAAAAIHAKLVHYSTDFVFNGRSDRPYLPEDPVDPLSAYGRSKLLGEQLIQGKDKDFLLIRTAWLYGPGGPNFPLTMINAARAGKPLKVVDDQIGSPTFTHDLAEATLNLIDADARGIYHVVNSGQTNWHDFTAAILEEFNLKTHLSRTTSVEWKKLRPNSAIRPAYSVLDTSKYEQTTGKTLRPWRDALRAFKAELTSRGGFENHVGA